MAGRRGLIARRTVAFAGIPGTLLKAALCYIRPPDLGDLMADNAQHGHAEAGGMDIRENVRTWHLFTKGVKWSIGGLILIALILLIFRTNG
jgi:hypothetical protein